MVSYFLNGVQNYPMVSAIFHIFFPTVLLGVILLQCGPAIDCLIDDAFCYQTEYPPPSPEPQISPSPDPHVEQQWGMLSNDKAERECLQAAKNAVGFPDSLGILACHCRETVDENKKIFRCGISAIDNKPHPVLLTCFKATRLCTVVHERGSEVYTFDELEQRLGTGVG